MCGFGQRPFSVKERRFSVSLFEKQRSVWERQWRDVLWGGIWRKLKIKRPILSNNFPEEIGPCSRLPRMWACVFPCQWLLSWCIIFEWKQVFIDKISKIPKSGPRGRDYWLSFKMSLFLLLLPSNIRKMIRAAHFLGVFCCKILFCYRKILR